MAQTEIPAVKLADGLTMPMVGLGTWQLHGQHGYDAVRTALDVGYRLIDTATMYGNEAEVGRAVRDSGIPREELFLTTKLPPRLAGRERETIAASLRDLGTDYIDLWLIHWPPNGGAAPGTWDEFIIAREQGLARSIGVSNYSTAQIDELTSSSGQTPVVNQIPWSPRDYDERRLRESGQRGVVVEGYSPLKGSNLRNSTLLEIASRVGASPAQVVLRWHLEHGIVVIPKSSNPERIAANVDLFSFELPPDDVARIDAVGNR